MFFFANGSVVAAVMDLVLYTPTVARPTHSTACPAERGVVLGVHLGALCLVCSMNSSTLMFVVRTGPFHVRPAVCGRMPGGMPYICRPNSCSQILFTSVLALWGSHVEGS